jgi:hypothetical protein
MADHSGCRWGTSLELPMRLTSIIAVAAVSTLLASCFGREDSKKPWMVHDQLGFKRGTPEHANCRLELARQATPRGGVPAAPD